VSDPGIVAAGHAERVERLLKSARLKVVFFGRPRENPTTRDGGRMPGRREVGGR